MATRRTHGPAIDSGTPASFGQASATPHAFPSHDHSFTLQTVLELQKSVGELCAEVRLTRDAVEKINGRLDKIDDKVSAVTHKLYAAGVVVAILLTVGGFVLTKAWDMAANHLAELAKTAITQQAK